MVDQAILGKQPPLTMIVAFWIAIIIATVVPIVVKMMASSHGDIEGVWTVDAERTEAWYAAKYPDEDEATREEKLAPYLNRVLTLTEDTWRINLVDEKRTLCEEMTYELDVRERNKLVLQVLEAESEGEKRTEPLELHFPEAKTWFYLDRTTADGTVRIYYRKEGG